MSALDKHDWHVTRTAEALGLADHSSLLKIMRRHGLSKSTSARTPDKSRVSAETLDIPLALVSAGDTTAVQSRILPRIYALLSAWPRACP